jgi:membrane protein DedA with SNARE-associated domain
VRERTGGAGSRYTDVMAHSSAQSQHEADSAASPEAAPPRRKHTAFDRFLLRAGAWFARHTRIRALVVGAIVVFALVLGLVLLIFPNITDGLEGFGYGGVFLINLLSTSTLFIPVPGLTATAQALIIREGKHAQFPWLVGITGGLGMGLGEITLYYAGYLGAELVKGREMHGPHWLVRSIEWCISIINRLMRRWGAATLFVLSAVPNPLLEVAGLTAGSSQISFRKFLIATVSGKVVRGLLLAYIGTQLPFV